MPGMAVILGARGNSAAQQAALDCMIAALTFPGHQTARLTDETFGLAAAHTAPLHPGGSALGASAAGQIAALVEGEPIGLPPQGKDTGQSRAHALAALYEARGVAGLARLAGHWAAVILDRRRGEVILANDAFGIRPLYRMRNPSGGWLFATNPGAILSYPGVPRGVSRAGLADYLAFGFPLGARTLFEGMERLPAATILTFSGDAVRQQRYWTPAMRQNRRWTRADLEEVRSSFNRSVLDMVALGGPASLATSGGGDSRAVLSALLAGGHNLDTVTHAIAEATDARIAAELAALTGARHHFYETRGEDILSHIEEGARLTAGQVAGIEAHPLAFLSEYPAFTRAMLTGLGGNLFKGSFLSGEQHATAQTLPELADWLTERHSVVVRANSDFEPLLAADCYAELRDLPRHSVLEVLSQMSDETPMPRQSVVFYLEERVCKYLVKGDSFVRREIEARHPFMERELLLQAWRFPSDARSQGIIPSYIITRNAPELFQVPVTWAVGRGLPLRPYRSASVGRFLTHLSQIKQNYEEKRHKKTRKVYNYRYAEWLREAMRPLAEQVLLDPRTLARPYFRPETIRRWVEEHMAGQNRFDKLSALISLELTLRAYVDAVPGPR